MLKPFADAWASRAISLKTRVLFCIENSLDAKLVARALELAFAARFFPTTTATATSSARCASRTRCSRPCSTPYKTSAPRTSTRRSSTERGDASTRRCACRAASNLHAIEQTHRWR